MKHVISVGFDIPGEVVEIVSFRSSTSLLDADSIVFSPEIEGYYGGEPYLGKPCLTDDSSARIVEDSLHWQRELEIALQAGKTVFVVMSGVDDVYVHTGRKEYSGTGRNARVTRIVENFDPYSSVPVDGLVAAIRRSEGDRIKTAKGIGPLTTYWQEFGAATYYDIYLEQNIGTPALVTQTGDKMVGESSASKNGRVLWSFCRSRISITQLRRGKSNSQKPSRS